MEAVINTPIKMTVKFHDILYGFYTHQGTGTAIMELNMSQELDRIYQDPLFLLSLDLRKAYDTLDFGRLLHTLKSYRAGPKLCGILVELW